MDRQAFNFTIKSIDEDRREFEGWASTGTRDRIQDELVPQGALFKLPLPVLLDHNHTQVCGEVYKADVSKAGIKFFARIKKIAEQGAAKDFVDYCWALLKNSLRPMVSVGFQPLEWEQIPDGGIRYTKWSWYELSAVAVGANPDCVVTGTKDAKLDPVVRLSNGSRPTRVVKLNPVARARINGTLKINATPKWKPGDPIKIVRTGPAVVKLPREACTWLKQHERPPVVKLTAKDHERAKNRVVRLAKR